MTENQKIQIFAAIRHAQRRVGYRTDMGMDLSKVFIDLELEVNRIAEDPELVLYDPE